MDSEPGREAIRRSGGDPNAPAAYDRLGMVVGGSLSEGLEVKLDADAMIEGVAVGRYVVIDGQQYRFFSMITDVALASTNPMIARMPPESGDDFTRQVLAGATTYGSLHLTPMLALDKSASDKIEPRPVKSIPGHFSLVYNASEGDVAQIFGAGDEVHFFHIGEPLDMEGIKIHLNLERFVQRSSGVFGKSGTGKTFLTRMLLAGVVDSDAAVNLIFDMHNEYGWSGTTENKQHGSSVKGLKQLFGARVAIFSLDEESSRRRQSRPDELIRIGFDHIEPADLEMLTGLINLTEPQIGAMYTLHKLWGKQWLSKFRRANAEEIEELVDQHNQNSNTLAALQRRLSFLDRFTFLQESVTENPLDRILEYIRTRRHIVLEFGRFGNSLEAYILVANYLTRRIHEEYVMQTEKAIGEQATLPPHLVITIEEAHKFLDPQIARQTIFGTIARELRKYNVTLLIVDQRPSGIDEEVMSQIGTRVTCLLDNERDIAAVFTGIAGGKELRQVLARLDTRQQALILGHAVPMPVVVKTRDYGSAEFYSSFEKAGQNGGLEDNVRKMRGAGDDRSDFFG
ncbi:MAG: ATP-binding protein [Chloroflexi bacterium]|nr:ATP-binding protein [Chloroflexota bacterium]